MKKFIRIFWFVLFLFAMVMFYVAPVSVPDYVDKFYHFIGFAIFAMLSIALFAAFFDNKWLNTFLVFLLIFGGVIAGAAELAQKQFSTIRSCTYEDWIANLCGIIFVTLFVYLANSRQESNIDLFEEKFDIESFS
ncbi:MAG TPA: hypothetical protein DDW90_08730 [Cyanobacteria bacterium UBA9971]|nr:hypothetical protein [Cyanobacteria bacterium UBA9971]